MRIIIFLFALFTFLKLSSCKKDEPVPGNAGNGSFQLFSIRVGTFDLKLAPSSSNIDAPIDQPLVATFSTALDVSTTESSIQLLINNTKVPGAFSYLDNNKTFSFLPQTPLLNNQLYTLTISDKLKGSKGEAFPGYTISFATIKGTIQIISFKVGGVLITGNTRIVDVSQDLNIEIEFSKPVNPQTINPLNITVAKTGQVLTLNMVLSNFNQKLTITASQKMDFLSRYRLILSQNITGAADETFPYFSKDFYTRLDTTPKFPAITDDELLTLVQQQTFKYFYDFAEPNSGMARERNTSGNLVTTGGTGFGLMAMVVAIERSFITRQQGVDRLTKIVSFLEKADRFHGAWSHWVDGTTGKVIPFSTRDNGGDLVETSFLVQGLLTFRQYLAPADTVGNNLINRITKLYEDVEWDWYRKNNENVLYWHWSPNYNWDMNFAMYGYFEQQITYFLAAASPTHSIPKNVYTNGFCRNGAIVQNKNYYGIDLKLGGLFPLFWVHYSYLGLDPHFSDDYANYWEQNVNASLINNKYCATNPKSYVGYSADCWGLTSSDNQNGYGAHSPGNDIGVITPTAALSSFPYTPVESMQALKFFYYMLGDKIWGQYGFYDSFNLTEGWVASSYLAIDQGPIIVMIENYRTGLLWKLFMSSPEAKNAISKLNFVY